MGTDIQRRIGLSRGKVPKVLGGVDCTCVATAKTPDSLSFSASDMVRVAFRTCAQAALWKCDSRLFWNRGLGGKPEELVQVPVQEGLARFQRLFKVEPLLVAGYTFIESVLKTKYWLSLHLCCLRNARFVKFNDTHDYSTCIICWLLRRRQRSFVEANRSRINNGYINRSLYNEFTDLPILLTRSVLSRFALIPAQKWLRKF